MAGRIFTGKLSARETFLGGRGEDDLIMGHRPCAVTLRPVRSVIYTHGYGALTATAAAAAVRCHGAMRSDAKQMRIHARLPAWCYSNAVCGHKRRFLDVRPASHTACCNALLLR